MAVTADPGRRSVADTLAGIALLLGIPALLALKSAYAGWYLVILIWLGGVFLVIAWALAWVIAFQTFFARRNAFAVTGGVVRMRIAAWLHTAALALAGAIAPDGGDDAPYPSVLGAMLGLPTGDQQDLVLVAYLALLAGALVFVWIVAEWITALVLRRRARTVAPGGPR